MSLGIACLMSTDMAQAQRLAKELNEMNATRREIEGDMQDAAIDQAEQSLAAAAVASGLVLFNDTWHQGVVGLVASRIKERYWRPTIAFAPAEENNPDSVYLRGSGRSIVGFHLRDALDVVSKRHPDLIEKFGGHAMAAGLTLAANNLPAFKTAFEAVCTELLTPAVLARVLLTDTPPAMSKISVADVVQLDAQVWGQAFEAPLFESTGLILEQRLLNGAHLKLKIDINGTPLDAIWFGRSETLPVRVRVAYRLGINEFRGNRRIQAVIEHAVAA